MPVRKGPIECFRRIMLNPFKNLSTPTVKNTANLSRIQVRLPANNKNTDFHVRSQLHVESNCSKTLK